MALLDVGDVFDDPELTGFITVKRFVENVTDEGISQPTVQLFQHQVAIVTGGKASNLLVLTDAQRVTGLITVHTPFLLVDGTPTRKADHILFQGGEYVVLVVKNFSNFGAGFVTAECQLFGMQNAEPIREGAPEL